MNVTYSMSRSFAWMALGITFACSDPYSEEWQIDSRFSDSEYQEILYAMEWWCEVDAQFCWQYFVSEAPGRKWSIGRIDGVLPDDVIGLEGPMCYIRLLPDALSLTMLLQTVAIHEIAHCVMDHDGSNDHHSVMPGSVLSSPYDLVLPCLSNSEAIELCDRYECDPSRIGHLCKVE